MWESSGRMKPLASIAILLALLASLTGCKRSLDSFDVREFVDHADDAARKRFAPEICKLRGETFTLEMQYTGIESRTPNDLTLDRKLYCREAGKFAMLRQYKLERESIYIDVSDDKKTAKVVAEYIETRPYYPPDFMPATPDDFRDMVIVKSHDESVVGIESGDLVFLSAKVSAQETRLVPKGELNLPYD